MQYCKVKKKKEEEEEEEKKNSLWTMNLPMFKLDLEKAKEPEIKLPTPTGS